MANKALPMVMLQMYICNCIQWKMDKRVWLNQDTFEP